MFGKYATYRDKAASVVVVVALNSCPESQAPLASRSAVCNPGDNFKLCIHSYNQQLANINFVNGMPQYYRTLYVTEI